MAIREEQAAFDRVLATVLFTDIVGSTEQASTLGDRGWKQLIEKHHAKVRALLGRFRGHEVDTAGDGFFATFDGPGASGALRRGHRRSVESLGIEVRAGLHTGEVETIDGKAGGLAVVIGVAYRGPRRAIRGPGRHRPCVTSPPVRASRSRIRRPGSQGRPGPLAPLPGAGSTGIEE